MTPLLSTLTEFAQANGVQSFGWIPSSEFTEYLREIESRSEYDFQYRSREQFIASASPPPFAKSLLVLLVDFFLDEPVDPDGFRLSSYSRACWQNIGPAADKMIQYLKAMGYMAAVVDVPARTAAVKAGLGFIGKNTLFYAHGMGSYIGIAVIGTDLEIEPAPANQNSHTDEVLCEGCTKCIRACPTGAIHQNGYRITPQKCISFLNRHPEDPTKSIPSSTKKLGRWLHGCEICQNCCPMNKAANHSSAPKVDPEINLYGMSLPNKASVDASIIAEHICEINDADFLAYVKALLAERR